MTIDFKNPISKASRNNPSDFVTHQELQLVYIDLRDDINKLSQKTDQGFMNLRTELKNDIYELSNKIDRVRDEAHRELIEVKNELKADINELKADVAELKADVADLKTDMSMIKNYLFTQLSSDIKKIVKECLAETKIA